MQNKNSLAGLSLYRFGNELPEGGYVWVWDDWQPAIGGPDGSRPMARPPYLIEAGVFNLRSSYPVTTTSPLRDEPGLFQKFEALSHDAESIRQFCNQHGRIFVTDHLTDPRSGQTIPAQSIIEVTSELNSMKIASHLWSAIKREDHRELQRFIRWSPKSFQVRILIESSPKGIAVPSSERYPVGQYLVFSEWLVRTEAQQAEMRVLGEAGGWLYGSTLGPSRLALQRIINKRLEKYCYPRLYLDGKGNSVGLTTPTNLLGCMWLQLYQDVAGHQKLIQCEICKQPMNVTENRSDKRAHDKCSNQERARRFREKQKLRT